MRAGDCDAEVGLIFLAAAVTASAAEVAVAAVEEGCNIDSESMMKNEKLMMFAAIMFVGDQGGQLFLPLRRLPIARYIISLPIVSGARWRARSLSCHSRSCCN